MEMEDFIKHSPSYSVGDILELVDYDKVLLIEDIDNYRYYYRNLLDNTTGNDTFFYIDIHRLIVKVG